MYQSILSAPSQAGSAPAAAAVALFEKTAAVPAAYVDLDRECGGVIAAALKRQEFTGARGTMATLFPQRGPGRVYLLGLGGREKFGLEEVRVAAARLVKAAFAGKVDTLAVRLGPALAERSRDADHGQALAEGLALGNFDFSDYKGTAGKAEPAALALRVSVDAALRAGFATGLKTAASANLARALAATPPNVANPAYLVQQARALARRVGLTCRVIDARAAGKLGMGGLLAVGSAGSTPPALIALEWPGRPGASRRGARPARGKEERNGPVLLVGKAVTFDTGGYSIKPAENMDRMKYDKCGGMAVLGALHAAATLEVDTPVAGLIPAAENLINHRAYRPGDILTFCNGVTAEITNTDAEGRLILADALAYGTRHYRPRAVVDLATLTGGVVVALGTHCAGCFCADPGLRGRLFDAADFTGERLWHLPLWDEHRAQIKGLHADLVNSAGRDAHPIQGAAFLSHFVGEDAPTAMPQLPWAHLDIAGTADLKADGDLYCKGPTGYGVRLLTRMLTAWTG